MRSSQVRHQNPRFLVSFFPADTHRCSKFMLFPQNYLTIPFLPLFFNKMLALQPIMKALAVLFAEPFVLLDSQYLVPSHLPPLMNQFQTTEPPTSQHCSLRPLTLTRHP